MTDSATLTTTPATVASLQVSPANAVVPTGQAQTYAVTGADRFGNALGDLTSSATFIAHPRRWRLVDRLCRRHLHADHCRRLPVVSAVVGGVSGTATLVAQALEARVAVSPVSGMDFGGDVPVSATVTSLGRSQADRLGPVRTRRRRDRRTGPAGQRHGLTAGRSPGCTRGVHTCSAASYISDERHLHARRGRGRVRHREGEHRRRPLSPPGPGSLTADGDRRRRADRLTCGSSSTASRSGRPRSRRALPVLEGTSQRRRLRGGRDLRRRRRPRGVGHLDGAQRSGGHHQGDRQRAARAGTPAR